MRRSNRWSLLACAAAVTVLSACGSLSGKSGMSFFVTSAGPGKGGDLGVWPVPTDIASRWPRRSARATARGGPTSAPSPRPASPA